MYSVTYKHCPFCNEDGTGRWDDPDTPEEDYRESRGGGKRLLGGSGGGRPPIVNILSTLASLALIVAAVCIVVSILKPAKTNPTPSQPSAAASGAPTPTAPVEPSAAASAEASAEPSAPAVNTPAPPQVTTGTVELVTPTDFKLNREDFTFDHVGETFQMRVTYTPENARGDITWKSSDPNIAAVTWNGMVTAVSEGTVTLTANVAGVGEKKCIVRCNFKAAQPSGEPADTQAPAQSDAPAQPSAAPAASLKLNREDFTLSRQGETFRMIVSGTSSAVTWASSNTDVATIGADGTVTAVAKGTCKVTATVDGVTLECIVRCNF